MKKFGALGKGPQRSGQGRRAGASTGGRALTLAGLVSTCRLVPRLAAAAADGYHPLSLPVAVQPRGAAPCLAPTSILLWLCMSHTGAHGRHQGGAPGATGLRLREGGEGAEHGGAGVREEFHGHEGQAGPSVLEGHVEATLGQGAEAPLFDVELQPGPRPGPSGPHRPGGGGREALVPRDRVHLGPAFEVPGRDAVGAVGLLGLAVVEREGLATGAAGHAQAGAGPHGEVQPDVRPLGASPLHEVGLQPVVLPGAWRGPGHVAGLEGPREASLVVQNAHFVPLQGGEAGRPVTAQGLQGAGSWGGGTSLPLRLKINWHAKQSEVRSLIPLVSTRGFLPQIRTLGTRAREG